jgi:PadR family transcriptional regulator, regulatory protein PadR
MKHKKNDTEVTQAKLLVSDRNALEERPVKPPRVVTSIAAEPAESRDKAATKEKVYIGEFEELVLLAILKLGANAYGVGIHDALEEATNRSYSIGALYTTLSRLEDKGLVRSWEGEATKERGGRAKRYYEVQASGERALREAENARRNLAANLDTALAGARR